MAARPIPSVLLHRPIDAPSSSSANWRPVPGPPTTTAGQIRCSQCKKYKPLTEYPVRLINLQPYQVCVAHGWYWTPAKQLSQWAPARRSEVGEVCREVARLLGEKAQGKWLVEGEAEDLRTLVERIAAAGNWSAEEVQIRPSTAKGDAAPSPTWVYDLCPSSTHAAPATGLTQCFKLQLWHHEAAGAYTIALKADGMKEPGPWARPGRVRPSQTKRQPDERRAEPNAAGAVPPAVADIPVTTPAAPKKRRRRIVTAAPSAAAARDREQMPPPPVPSTRPVKKARRVEPQLVSPMPTSSAPTALSTPFSAAATEWSHFLSFPTLLAPPPPPPPPPSHQPTAFQQQQQDDFPLDPLLLSSFSAVPHPAPAVELEPRPLSLAELLSSAIFEPPMIDLPPRAPVASRAGRELDAAVADALGATPDALDGEEEEEEESDDDEEEGAAGEGYYEDSIPDESSAEEDDDADPDDEGDGASVSSFFESSAEETDYGEDDAGGRDVSEDEGEDNWLEGFAAQQMGLRRDAHEDDEEEEEEEEIEDDELGEEEPVAAPAKRSRARATDGSKGSQRRGEAAEDEVDELDSPSGSEER